MNAYSEHEDSSEGLFGIQRYYGAFEFKERTREGGKGQTGLEPYRPH